MPKGWGHRSIRYSQSLVSLVDTHCHLNDLKAFPDPEIAVEEAFRAGVSKMVVVGVDTESSQIAINLAERFESIYAAAGWHPTHTADYTRDDLKTISEMLEHPKVVALGEIGLDYHWDYATPEQQYVALIDQLDLAKTKQKPIIFHCREAEDALLDILEKREGDPPYLFHCFAGNDEHARRALALKATFGVDGPITYNSADPLRSVVAKLGIENILLETDAPWMTPVPHRGTRNKPAYLPHICATLASIYQITEQECAEITTNNANRFFGW